MFHVKLQKMKRFIMIVLGVAGIIYTGSYLITAEYGTCFINQFFFYAMVICIIVVVYNIMKMKQDSENEN